MTLKYLKNLITPLGLSLTLVLLTIYCWSWVETPKAPKQQQQQHLVALNTFVHKDDVCNPIVLAERMNDNSSQTIPKIILQTHIDKTLIPFEVYHNIKKYAPDYTHLILNDEEALDFLEHYFHSSVKERFLRFTNGAHKADILRYALLYVYGGVYLDIKTELIKPLDELLLASENPNTIYTVISSVPNSMYQGIIATPPRKTFFLDLIDFMIRSENPIPETYLKFTNDFYFKVKKDVLAGSKTNLSEGLNVGVENRYFLFQEVCSSNSIDCYDGLDRYGVCCYATLKGERIIKIRRSSYPWFKNRLGKKLIGPLIFHDK